MHYILGDEKGSVRLHLSTYMEGTNGSKAILDPSHKMTFCESTMSAHARFVQKIV